MRPNLGVPFLNDSPVDAPGIAVARFVALNRTTVPAIMSDIATARTVEYMNKPNAH